ncbi:hypothetical protein HY311_02275 [Candidatus Nomurabacteria bacterium]|nr:hypothetical protein [Candidatus Nomurabacteria bacterium]
MKNNNTIYAVAVLLIVFVGVFWFAYFSKPIPTMPTVPYPALNSADSQALVPPATAGPGERCGGNMTTALQCGVGYHCAPNPGSHLPFGDVGGTCVSNALSPDK